jgi:hypothetical protein
MEPVKDRRGDDHPARRHLDGVSRDDGDVLVAPQLVSERTRGTMTGSTSD